MTAVNKIKLELTTSVQQPDPNIEGESFLFIGGREFWVNQAGHDDKKRDGFDVITLGEGSNAEESALNDPRKPYGTAEPLVIEDLDKYPLWLRFDPVDGKDWHLDRALVEVFAKGDADNKPRKKYEILSGGPDKKLVLGRKKGLYVSLGPSTPSIPTTPTTPTHPT